MVMMMVLLQDRLRLSLKFSLIRPANDIGGDTQMLFQNVSQHCPWAKRLSSSVSMIVLVIVRSLGIIRVVVMEHAMRRR